MDNSTLLDNEACSQLDKTLSEYEYYVASFSTSRRLSQWVMYADNAEGICLEFDSKKLYAFLEGRGSGGDELLYLSHVIYDLDKQKEHIVDLYEKIRHMGDSYSDKTLAVATA